MWKLDNRAEAVEGIYMVDFMVEIFTETADVLITFWLDNVIDKLTERRKQPPA